MTEATYRRKDAAYWRGVHETALERLAEMRAERDVRDAELEELNREIVQLEQLITSLFPFTADVRVTVGAGLAVDGVAGLGLADACREILKKGTSYRTARGIRDSLAASGYGLKQHSNPLASIHGVLKRLAEGGEVEQLEAEGKTRYRWKETSSKRETYLSKMGKEAFNNLTEKRKQRLRAAPTLAEAVKLMETFRKKKDGGND